MVRLCAWLGPGAVQNNGSGTTGLRQAALGKVEYGLGRLVPLHVSARAVGLGPRRRMCGIVAI